MKRILCAFILIFSACQYDCGVSGLSLIFVGYSNADVDTIVLRKFTGGQRFANLLDTVLITNDHVKFTYGQLNDTTGVFPLYYRDNERPIPGFDWEVYIPSQNRTIKISNIVVDESKVPSKSRPCPIVSFMQDSNLISYPQAASNDDFNTGEFRMYISK